MGNNDNRVVTWSALNSYIEQNDGSPKKLLGANNLALRYGEFSEYAPIATATSSGVVLSPTYTGTGDGAYTSTQVVIEKDVSWSTYETPVPTNIVVNPKTSTLDIGSNPSYPSSVQLSAIVTAPTGADTSVTWTSSNTQIASVDNTGLVTAHVVGGPVTITATTSNNLSDTATITVIQTDSPAIVTQYSISWSGAHAGISGSTSPVTLNEGSTWSGTFVADTGYEITNISTTGSNVTTNGNTVSVSDLQSNVTITVTTEQVQEVNHRIQIIGDNIDESQFSSSLNFSSTNPNDDPTDNHLSVSALISSSSSGQFIITPASGYKITGAQYTALNETPNAMTLTTVTSNPQDGDPWTFSIANVIDDVMIEVNTQLVTPASPTLTVSDMTVRIGEEKYVSYQLSDPSITINNIEFEIEDTNKAEITGDETLYKKVLGKAVGQTTVTVTINDTIVGTGTITVVRLFDGLDGEFNAVRGFDIFGNSSPIKDSYGNGWNTGIPDGDPNGDYETPITTFDQYNINTWYIPGQLNSDTLSYISQNIETSDSWISARILGQMVIVNLDPWYEKIEDLKNSATYNAQIGANVIVNLYGGTSIDTYHVTTSSSFPTRTGTITLHASDGSSIAIPIKQYCTYGGKCTGGGGSEYRIAISVESNNIWSSVDWYAPEGTTGFTSPQNRTFIVDRNQNVQAFAVLNPASSVQGITGLPSVIVAQNEEPGTISDIGNVYDSSFVNVYTTTPS